MRRFLLGLCLVVAAAAPGNTARADPLRFPPAGKPAFQVTLLKGWHSKADTRGGLLLVPPPQSQHAMVYIAVLTDETLRGADARKVAGAVAKVAGFELNDKQDPARVSDPTGARIYRGTAFYGSMPPVRGLARKAKIVIFPLSPNTWAQIWVITQPGIGAVEIAALEQVLDGIALVNEP